VFGALAETGIREQGVGNRVVELAALPGCPLLEGLLCFTCA